MKRLKLTQATACALFVLFFIIINANASRAQNVALSGFDKRAKLTDFKNDMQSNTADYVGKYVFVEEPGHGAPFTSELTIGIIDGMILASYREYRGGDDGLPVQDLKEITLKDPAIKGNVLMATKQSGESVAETEAMTGRFMTMKKADKTVRGIVEKTFDKSTKQVRYVFYEKKEP
jgi:hypothetical protein